MYKALLNEHHAFYLGRERGSFATNFPFVVRSWKDGDSEAI